MQNTSAQKTLAVTFRQLLDESVRRYGEMPGILYAEKNNVVAKTYNDLYRDSYYAACQLALQAGNGVHIGICAKNSYVFFCYLNGILISSNTVIPFQQGMEREKMLTLIRQADITVMIVDQECADRLGTVDGVQIIILPEEIQAHSPVPLGEDDPDRVALIMFTSGTTSAKMKGVMLTHRALITNVHYRGEENINQLTLSVLPMHHIFGFACDYLDNISDGAAMAINGGIENIGENLLRYQPHFLRLVPMMAEGLLRKVKMVQRLHPEFTPRQAAEAVYGKRIRKIITAGAKLTPKLGAEYDKLGIRIQQGYGMTETGPRIAVPDEDKVDPNAAGNVISICQTRFADGELQIKSPSLMLGYYKDDEETAKVFTEDGWFRTGDLGYITSENRLYITGRIKNLIIRSNGENISPEEIERQFADHPLITEVMAYEENNKIVAEFYPDTVFASQNGITDINAYIRHLVDEANRVLSSEKEVQVVKLRDDPFPRTASGKIIRKTVNFQV